MSVDALRRALATQPFRPFILQLANGDSAVVPHPEFIWVHPTDPRTIAVADEDGGVRLIDLLLVVEIQYTTSRHRRRRAG